MSAPHRFGQAIIGAGAIAARHMDAFRDLGETRPTWIVTRTEPQAQEFAGKWGFPNCGTVLDPVLSDAATDVVVITSPNSHHAEQTRACLAAGKDVIVEIPAALDLAESEAILRLARERGRRVLVCHTMRSLPAVRLLRDRVRQGILHVTQVAGYFAVPRRRNQGPAGARSWADNLLWHHGGHLVDTAMWVLGSTRIRNVQALFGCRNQEFGMVMDACVQFATEANQLVTLGLTYNTGEALTEMRIIADEGLLTYRNMTLWEQDRILLEGPVELDLLAQNSTMLTALRSGSACDYDLEAVLPAMSVLQKAQDCAVAATQGVEVGEF